MNFNKPIKKRKLTGISSPGALVVLPKNTKDTSESLLATSKCMSCFRSLNVMQKAIIICARCSSPTCAVCSRTCTACPTSMPPTPYLTRSPTRSPTPLFSPRRTALSIHSVNTDINDLTRSGQANISNGQKRKSQDEDNLDYDSESWVQKLGEFDLTLGCGRTVCRKCCVENRESASETCHDCATQFP